MAWSIVIRQWSFPALPDNVYHTRGHTSVPVRMISLPDFQVQRGNRGWSEHGRPEVSKGFQGESSAGTISSKIGRAERSNLTN